jgi:hypothetical protein
MPTTTGALTHTMRKLPVLIVALVGAIASIAFAVAVCPGSSHREAPLTSLDPTGDNTDVYAFVAPDAPDSLTLIANWIPFEDPAGGPNFYRFDDRAAYYINVDNSGDGVADVRYRFRFRTTTRNPDSFLYALPGVTSISDPKLNVVQTYSVTRERYVRGRLVDADRIAENVPVAPNNVGPKTIPDYGAVAQEAIRPVAGGGKVFAGPVEDPFFVDLGTTFDAINIRKGTGNAGGGKDDLAGYNVHTIALQVPKSQVTKDRRPVGAADADNAIVGVWSTTNRPRFQVATTSSKRSSHTRRGHNADWRRGEVQVSRLGNPLINEVIIPLGRKDMFNATQPQDDAANFGKYATSPELAKVINILFPGLNVPESGRDDIVTALLTGVPGLTKNGANPAAADTLKINLGVPPTATPNRFGVLAGDNQGFPNGRRLTDDVVDISLRVVGGFLKGNKLPLGDGVDVNDRPLRTAFPYEAAPNNGFDSQLKRVEPEHAPTPGQP